MSGEARSGGSGRTEAPEDRIAAFGDTPVNRAMGMRLVGRTPERSEVAMALRPEFEQEEGVVHGGLLAMLADTAAVYLLYPDLGPGEHMTGVEFKMSFLRPVLADGEDLRGVAEPVRKGRTLAVCRSDVFQGDRHVAVGLFTFYLQRTGDGGTAPEGAADRSSS